MMYNSTDIDFDNVEIEDANELAKQLLLNVKPDEIPEGKQFNGITCVDCGDNIPTERLKVTVTCRCAECKEYFIKEQRAKSMKTSFEEIY